jgi:HK97 family phage major capsid protein
VYATHEGLPARWEDDPNTVWMANKAIINDIRQFATANNYHGFLVDLGPSSTGRLQRTLLGYPLYSNSHMDGVIATGNDDVLILGAFDQFVIVDRIGASVEFVPLLFNTANNLPGGQRGWLMHWRVGSDSIVDDAFRVLRV